jgi:MFS family permease
VSITANSESLTVENGRITDGWKATFGGLLALTAGPSVLLVMCFAVFTPALRAEFGWGVGDVAVAAMLGALCVAIISPIQGRLCDRFGSRIVILVSFPLFGLALISMSQLNGDIRWFYAGYVAATMFALGVWPLSFMRCVTSWFDKRLGLALGVVNIGPGLGGALAPLLVGGLIAAFGWRTSFLVTGLIAILIAWPVAYFWVRERPAAERIAGRQGRLADGLTSPQVLRDRSFWLLIVTFAFLGVFSGSILLNQVTILTDNGLPRNTAIAAQSALGLSSIVARLVTGWLLDRTHLAKLMPAILIIGAAACWLYTVPEAGSFLLLSSVVVGFIIGAEFDVLGYAIRRYHGMMQFGLVYGLIFGIFQIGSAAGIIGMGIIHDQNGSFDIAIMGLIGICCLIAILFAMMGKYRFITIDPEQAVSANGKMIEAP